MQLAVWIAGGLMVLASATAGPRISIRVWRDPAYADKMTQAGRVLPFGYATAAEGSARCLVSTAANAASPVRAS